MLPHVKASDCEDLTTKTPNGLLLQKLPTFLYAMPFSPTCVFLEETSLVAKPAVPFPELKRRLEARMQHLGIKITKVRLETMPGP